MARPRKQPTAGADLAAIEGAETDHFKAGISSDDSKNGIDAIGPQWLEINQKALAIEDFNYPDRLITGIYFDGQSPNWWTGNHCECPVLPGEPAIRLHTCEIITL